MAGESFVWSALASEPLCVADFRVDGAIMPIGKSPFSERRVGYITGGEFKGAKFSGEILPGGGNWSLSGEPRDGKTYGAFDARSVWRTHDGALVYVTYSGRSVVPEAVAREFRDPKAGDVEPSRYYIRIAPVFETGDARYDWLNGILAIGCGQRMSWGIRHWMFHIR
jgi:hypothetical protein